jgi:hemerythrin
MAIQWTSDLSSGVKVIDNQHRKLIELINHFNVAVQTGDARKVLMDLFVDLADYTSYHFQTEEELMERHNYYDIEEHKKLHFEFKRKLAEYILQYRAGDIPMPVNVSQFMVDWLIEHIKGHTQSADTKLGKFLNSRDVF